MIYIQVSRGIASRHHSFPIDEIPIFVAYTINKVGTAEKEIDDKIKIKRLEMEIEKLNQKDDKLYCDKLRLELDILPF